MKTIHCLIVDDEPLAREIIATHITKIPNWNVIGSYMDAESAYEFLMKHSIDVIFLDIQMPVISGIEFLQSLKNPPMVVFTTAFSDYALKGFDLNAVDYLLKPITFARFCQAVEKIQEKLEAKLPGISDQDSDVDYFFIKQDGKLIRINFESIQYIKAEQEYSYLITSEAQLLVSMHLKLLEQQLPKSRFTRIHRSYIVPHDQTQSIHGNILELQSGLQLPIGSTYKETLLKKLNIR